MNFYLYENSQWNKVDIEISPALMRARDTSNDSFTCSLRATRQEQPYKPMTPFKIEYSEDESQIFWIISDSVSVFSINPQVFKHSLTLVQYRYFLNKHLIRNTVFNQPRKSNMKLFSSLTNYLEFPEDESESQFRIAQQANGDITQWNDTVYIPSARTKLKRASIKIKLYGTIVTEGDSTVINTSEITSVDLVNIKSNYGFYLYDSNNNQRVLNYLFPISNFVNSQIDLTTSQINTINNYLNAHSNVILKFLYAPGVSSTDLFELAFAVYEYGKPEFNNLTAQIYFEADVYNYTMYDVLETLLLQYRLTSDSGSKREQLFNLPTQNDELYDLLKNTYPPDTLNFTQATFYEALSEIFRFYDAGFKFDENKKIDIEYYNDRETQKTTTNALSGKQLAHADRNYNEGRITYYQNAVEEIKLPYSRVRCQTLGVPEKSDYGLVLPFPIYDILKLEYVSNFTATLPFVSSIANANKIKFSGDDSFKLDLTPFVVNSEIWSTLTKNPTPTGTLTTLQTVTTIPFERGSSFIGLSNYGRNWASYTFLTLRYSLRAAVSRFFGFIDSTGPFALTTIDFSKNVEDWENQIYNIEYIASLDGRVQTETVDNKYKGEILNNQNNGSVDLNKLGLNMFSESLKDGEPTLTCTYKITDWDNKIKEGDYIEYNGSIWVANIVNYRIFNGYIESSVEFVKNFNSLALRTKNDNEKRLTTISASAATKSEDNYIDYVYVTDRRTSPTRNQITLGTRILESMVGQTFGLDSSSYEITNIDRVSITTYDKNGTCLTDFEKLKTSSGTITKLKTNKVNIPLAKYGVGNCMCFEMQFNHPLNAGNRLVASNGVFGSTAFFSQATPYTDNEGWFEYTTLTFLNNARTMAEDGLEYFPYLAYDIYNPLNNELISEQTEFNIAGSIDDLYFYKKPNEVFCLNYEWCFLTYPSLINSFFIGNKFININAFMTPNKIKNKKYYLYYTVLGDPFKYSIMDTKGHLGANLTRKEIRFGTKSTSISTYFELYVLSNQYQRLETWAICDEEGDIYFASNTPNTIDSEFDSCLKIYFITRQNRIMEGETFSNLPEIPLEPSKQFVVKPSDWLEFPSTFTINATLNNPGLFIREDDHTTTAVYTFNWRLSAGTTINPKQIDTMSISPATTGMYTNTVTYTYVTEGSARYVDITATVYQKNWVSGSTIDIAISYSWVGATSYCLYNYILGSSDLVGETLINVAISPSQSPDGTRTNTISFNKNSGTFSGYVYYDSKPTYSVTYTISYDFD